MSFLAVRSLTEVLVSLGTNIIIVIISVVFLLLLPSVVLGFFQGLFGKEFKKNTQRLPKSKKLTPLQEVFCLVVCVLIFWYWF